MRKDKIELMRDPGSDKAQVSPAKIRKTRVMQTEVPRHSLHEALRVAQALNDQFAKMPTKPLNIAMALELAPYSSMFKMLLGASSAYGLTEGSHDSEVVTITELARRIVSPTTEGSEGVALREALLKPRVVKEFLSRYNNSRWVA